MCTAEHAQHDLAPRMQVGAEGLTFTEYRPAKLGFGAPHPDPVVETASLAAVEPPDVTYELHLQACARRGRCCLCSCFGF